MPGLLGLAGGKTLELEGEGQLVAGEAGGRPEQLLRRWEPKPLGAVTRMALAGDARNWPSSQSASLSLDNLERGVSVLNCRNELQQREPQHFLVAMCRWCQNMLSRSMLH